MSTPTFLNTHKFMCFFNASHQEGTQNAKFAMSILYLNNVTSSVVFFGLQTYSYFQMCNIKQNKREESSGWLQNIYYYQKQ